MRPALAGSADIPMVIGKFAVIFSLFMGIPVNLHPGRAQLTLLIKKKEFHNNSLHIILTIFMVLTPTLLAIVYPKIVAAISFIGGTLSVLFGVTIPCINIKKKKNNLLITYFFFLKLLGLAYVKLNNKKWNHYSNLTILIIGGILTAVAYLAAFVSLFASFGLISI